MQAFGAVRVRDILRLMTAYVVAIRNMLVCDSSTRPEFARLVKRGNLVCGGSG